MAIKIETHTRKMFFFKCVCGTIIEAKCKKMLENSWEKHINDDKCKTYIEDYSKLNKFEEQLYKEKPWGNNNAN